MRNRYPRYGRDNIYIFVSPIIARNAHFLSFRFTRPHLESARLYLSLTAQDLICPICRDVLRDAVISPQGDSYCDSCIRAQIATHGSCPFTARALKADELRVNRLARAMVDELQVLCPNGVKQADHGGWEEDTEGCLDSYKFGFRKAHLETCEFAPVVCPAGGTKCGPVLRADVQFHLEDDCPYVSAANRVRRKLVKRQRRRMQRNREDLIFW